ncbi:MAG: pyruvate, phosphate dikinase [Chloroflexi bacterium]|nr:pyruvate, phosphate dikinase [Chloroflexota bacterium]MCI0799586.1 pyruvate, phosphate dikinase [Chloroflexota bacterium]MCI0825602.1 pyruvate, phosphate dikinase [Chloroflexota bacterium]MCI0859604.1 pyruvate, phosphate dikinase [Chloroflexota bacterium]
MTTTAERTRKLVYRFDEGDASMSDLLGGKGSNLCEMVRMGLPIPPGFVVSTEVCRDYLTNGHQVPQGLHQSITENLRWLEKAIGRSFGSATNPLLVSVRSGAKISMPGMMDTILNLGINDQVVQGLATLMGEERPAYDAYRRFLQIYGEVVLEVKRAIFEEILSQEKSQAGVSLDYELSADQLRVVVADFKSAIRSEAGVDVPEDPWEQLAEAVEAVFRSWDTPRAIFYRDHNAIPHDLGTAVTIMAMVFGNLGSTSGTGVLFTRNPSTGQREIYGEFLSNAQGEDVVAGVRTPEQISGLFEVMPEAYWKLIELAHRLESHYRDVQDIEFTIENSRLFLLQTRNAKRTPTASVRAAVDMVREGMIDRNEALRRVDPEEVVQLLVPQFEVDLGSEEVRSKFLTRGSPASPGAATGRVYFDASRAASVAAQGLSVILVRAETRPDDIHGITASAGVVTGRGGVTSHAAVVTRGLGKPCIVGCESAMIDVEQRLFVANGRTVREGEDISIDGATGDVFYGRLETTRPKLEQLGEANELLAWADQTRKLGVMANADTAADAIQALAMGAEGIGLCRTEHMFLDPQRLPVVRQMLLNAPAAEEWRRGQGGQPGASRGTPDLPGPVGDFYHALARVLELQTQDFIAILSVMGQRPVIIRLLDAPLHEFLPPYEALLIEMVELRAKGAPAAEIREKEAFLRLVDSHRESNPMLGHRGCRLGISFPDIYRMQVEAIITASAELIKRDVRVNPEIMIPLTVDVREMRRLRQILTVAADRVQENLGVKVPYKFGTMIETPRAALTAGEIAKESDFFSFGTNDLTQMVYGFSRDDAEGKFLRFYIEQDILTADPFATIDADGVGLLVRMAVDAGRRVRPDLEIGICGEHGGDPASVAFCHDAGLDYVSCSPYRVPVARLAAAQAALASGQQ